MKKLPLLLVCLAFIGCSHQVSIEPAVSPLAHQLVDHKVEGHVAIFIHPELANLHAVIKPQSRTCSTVRFPIDAGQSIKSSLVKTAQGIFENIRAVDSVPQDHDFDGILAAELLDFDVDLKFNEGVWNDTAESWVELNIKLTFYDDSLKPVWYAVVGYTKKEFSDAGGTCGGGAEAISGGMEQCLKNISIQMTEKIADSRKIKAALDRSRRT